MSSLIRDYWFALILGAGRSGFTLFDPIYTVKPVLSGHSKIDKTKVFKKNGSLMKVESIAECSLGAFCNTFDLH